MDINELAAVDMHGSAGTVRRRRIILVEFVAGALLGTAFGVVVLVTATSAIWLVFGLWVVGIGLNYVPLTIHAMALRRRGALDDALRDVDLEEALRYYTVAQLWVFVPLAIVAMDVAARRR